MCIFYNIDFETHRNIFWEQSEKFSKLSSFLCIITMTMDTIRQTIKKLHVHAHPMNLVSRYHIYSRRKKYDILQFQYISVVGS